VVQQRGVPDGAVYDRSAVKALDDRRYEAAGRLTIKGQTQEIAIPATFTQARQNRRIQRPVHSAPR
jgi:polyisoprenoid-binding protein YceI